MTEVTGGAGPNNSPALLQLQSSTLNVIIMSSDNPGFFGVEHSTSQTGTVTPSE